MRLRRIGPRIYLFEVADRPFVVGHHPFHILFVQRPATDTGGIAVVFREQLYHRFGHVINQSFVRGRNRGQHGIGIAGPLIAVGAVNGGPDLGFVDIKEGCDLLHTGKAVGVFGINRGPEQPARTGFGLIGFA